MPTPTYYKSSAGKRNLVGLLLGGPGNMGKVLRLKNLKRPFDDKGTQWVKMQSRGYPKYIGGVSPNWVLSLDIQVQSGDRGP